jgi:hypothetical protein
VTGDAQPPTKPLRTWRPMILWSAGILLALGLAWFVAAVVVPIFQTRNAVFEYFEGGLNAEAAVERLGGPERAATKLRTHLRLPDRIAPYKGSAAGILVWGTMTREEAVAALRDPSGHVRDAASSMLAKTATPADREFIPQLLEALVAQDPAVRSRAASALGGIGPAAHGAVPELIKTLADADPYSFASSSAADALGRIGLEVRITVPALIKALQDPSPQVRGRAAEALGQIGPAAKAARPALLAATQDADPVVVSRAKFALQDMPPEYDPVRRKDGEPEPKSEIEKALASDDPEVRAAAAEILSSPRRHRTPSADVLKKVWGGETE